MIKINVSKTAEYPQPNWPKELKEAGFTGEMDVISDGITLVIVHPCASYESAIKSLKLAVRQLELKASLKV